ncbi:MAG: class I SAM-dependent methyltransferase [bacterium]
MDWQQIYLERFYPQTSWRRDGTRDFFQILKENCSGKILEIGSGPSNDTSHYLQSLGELHGIDIDPEVLQNSALKTSAIFNNRFPFAEATFDSCVSNYVCEHLERPVEHLTEVWRVLKPGGVYIFRTPNRLHYTAIVSRLTPHSFHLKTANKLRAIEGHDPYPTRYRLNSRAKIQKMARKIGFEVETLRLVEKEPSYGMSSRLLFLLFTAYERVVNSAELFASFRSSLFVVLRKRS